MVKPIRFTVDEAQAAGDAWGFNCGPGALCALLNMTPAEMRPHLGDFERKGYIGPTSMRQILDGMHIAYWWQVVPETYPPVNLWPDNSLIRVQWAGPWTKPQVPMVARYGHTHWIACRHVGTAENEVFDINATCAGGWMPVSEWTEQLVPWLLKQCEPKATGEWWHTHRVYFTTPRTLEAKNRI